MIKKVKAWANDTIIDVRRFSSDHPGLAGVMTGCVLWYIGSLVLFSTGTLKFSKKSNK